MRKFIFCCVIIGMFGILNSKPAPENSTIFTTTQSTVTEKAGVKLQTKEEKQHHIAKTAAISGSSANPADHVEATTKSTNVVSDVTVLPSSKNESKHKEEKMVPIAVSPLPRNVEPKHVTTDSPLSHKVQPTKPASAPGHHEVESMQSDVKTEKKANQKKYSPVKNKKPKKTSTNYMNEGKVVVFNGICGPEGCEIEGNIYDELVPITHTRKHN